MAKTQKEKLEAKLAKAKEAGKTDQVAKLEAELAKLATEPTAPEAPKSPKPGKNEARVTCDNPAKSRTYSLEAHGEDYANLANQYAGKNGCQVE